MSELRRFRRLVTQPELRTALKDPSQFPDEAVEPEIVLGDLESAVAGIVEGPVTDTSIDKELVEPLFLALGSLSKRDASDMRVWHWLTVEKFPELVVKRWSESGSKDELVAGDGPVASSLAGHFLGKSTLNGFARNTFSRIWWVAHTLDGDMERSRAMLGDAQALLDTFDRFYSAFQPAALAAVDRLTPDGLSESEVRLSSRWLRQTLGTTVLEALTKEQVEEILAERL